MHLQKLLQQRWFQAASLICILAAIYLSAVSFKSSHTAPEETNDFYTHRVDLKSDQLQFAYKNSAGIKYGSIAAWKKAVEKQGKKLQFATNGGMYHPNGSPVGLYVEKGHTVTPLNLHTVAKGNFYLQPNGVLAITKDNIATICKTADYPGLINIHYATQSGPMLLIDGKINPLFDESSNNIHIRNAVGLLPDGRLLFIMSKKKTNFYSCAKIFQENGCKNALYLDGFVSRIYAPDSGIEQLGGNFSVMIGVVKGQ